MSNAALSTPFWFDQRQCKAEEVSENYFLVSGPNLPEAYIGIRKSEDDTYQGYLHLEKDGEDTAITESGFTTVYNAWEAAFELYRAKVIL